MKNKALYVRISPHLQEQIRTQASREETTVSEMVRYAVKRYLEEV